MPAFTEVAGGTRVRLRVKPGARKNAILGVRGDALKVSVTAPPDRGKANDAVVALLAEALDLPARSVTIVSGQASQDKVIVVPLPAETTRRLLHPVRDE